jgi:hypothetical protein
MSPALLHEMTNLPGVAPVRRGLSELVRAGFASQPWRETIGKTGREVPLCRGFRLLHLKFAMHKHIYECSIRLGNFSRFSLFCCMLPSWATCGIIQCFERV